MPEAKAIAPKFLAAWVFALMVLLQVVCFDAPIIALAISSVNNFSRNPLENNPADVLGESDRVSLGPFAHTLRGLFGQRWAVMALFELAEAAGY